MTLIESLADELTKGRIYEATLVDPTHHLDGLCDEKGAITVDPRVSIVSTLLHELAHRRFPDWSESRVRRAETKVMSQLSQHDIGVWYRRYRRAVRKRRPVSSI